MTWQFPSDAVRLTEWIRISLWWLSMMTSSNEREILPAVRTKLLVASISNWSWSDWLPTSYSTVIWCSCGCFVALQQESDNKMEMIGIGFKHASTSCYVSWRFIPKIESVGAGLAKWFHLVGRLWLRLWRARWWCVKAVLRLCVKLSTVPMFFPA